MKIDLRFISDIISSHISGYKVEYDTGLITAEELNQRMIALNKLSSAIIEFIKESNKLVGE